MRNLQIVFEGITSTRWGAVYPERENSPALADLPAFMPLSRGIDFTTGGCFSRLVEYPRLSLTESCRMKG